MSNKSKARRALQVILSILGIAAGVALIAKGLEIGNIAADAEFYPTGAYGFGNLTHLEQVEFGADFYTEIYAATAFTGNVLISIFDMVEVAFPAAFELGGLLVILSSARKLVASLAFDDDVAPSASTESEPKNAETSLVSPESQDERAEADTPPATPEDVQTPSDGDDAQQQ